MHHGKLNTGPKIGIYLYNINALEKRSLVSAGQPQRSLLKAGQLNVKYACENMPVSRNHLICLALRSQLLRWLSRLQHGEPRKVQHLGVDNDLEKLRSVMTHWPAEHSLYLCVVH